MNLPRPIDLLTFAAALLCVTLASGCAGWPVQEMSNARQAITAAQKAGAQQYAPEALAQAQKLAADAKASATKGDYRSAREQYEQAREKAIEAREAAEAAKSPKPSTPGDPDPGPDAGAEPHP